MTNSMISYKTTFESTNNLPMQIAIGHGENADLIASFKDEGVDVNLTGYTARAIYQPRSEWGTDNWYECPCEIVDNTAIAHWGYTYDNGDNAVKMFIHLLKDGKVAYPAIYQMKLFETPGFSPGSIVPIQKTLDFSEYNLVNAPWVETEDYTSDIAVIRSDISDLDGVAVKSIEYTGTNKLIVKQFLQANPNAVVIWKADGLGTMTQNIFSKTSEDGEYWTYSCFDASTNQWAWFKLYTDWEISLDFILQRSSIADESDIEDIETQLTSVSNDISSLSGNVSSLSSNVSSLSGRVSTVESNITSTNNLIMNGIDREKTHYPNLTVTPLNRRMLDVDVTEYYSGNLTVQLPENPGDNKYYSVLVVANAKSGTLYLSLAQPLLNTWQIVIEDGLNLSDILQVPGGKIGIFYLYQMSGHPSVAGSWGGIHIRREICQVITP